MSYSKRNARKQMSWNRLEQQQQTISLLVSEKNSLSAAVERLEHAESALRETEQQLESERAQNAQLRGRVLHLEETAQASETQITSLVATERELTDKSRDQEREIHLLNGRVDELQAQSAEHLRKARELEEQIESDDRAERLEETLKNTQDRADELEFQLSKLQQAHAEGEAKRDELAQQLQLKAQAEADWQARHAESEEQHAVTKEQLTAVVSERDALLEARTALQTELEEGKNAVTELQQKLAALSSELSLNARQLKQVQAELRIATARAEDAEKTQKELQAEGIGLMRSLDEMRPKIVELTDAKLLLSENADSLQKTIQARDADIAQLESELDELRQQKESAEHERDRLAAALAADRTTQAKDASELQRAYAELQAEHAAAQKGVQDLEEERNKLRQLSNSNVEEIRRLTDSLQAQTTHAAALRAELAEQAQAQAEGADFLARAQADMEALRAELAQKDDELERLREDEGEGEGAGAGEGSSQSLDGEMLNALRQQHALELSAAQSQVRARETALFTAEAQVHAFQRQVAALEDELALLRSHPLQRPSSRGPLPHQLPHRTSSRTVDRSDDLRRASFSSHRAPTSSSLAVPAPASAFEGLSPETRHKRKVSLSMLKARIDSEVAASSHHPRSVSSPARRPTPLPAVVEPPSQPATPPPVLQQKRPVFMDEAHVFWCHACQGDLVVL
ncbi:hypothetical protein C2E23DRAFT_865184 [Lenzites betulinus]|nr:hypothetical protein C2E23DRAFT_865184 [Lenzites betulinus]